MSITVTKVSEAFYRVSATPPHVNEPWSAPEPLRMHELCRELIARGVHQIDAGDAVNDADRKWLARGRPNSGRNLIATGEANDEKEVFEFTVEPFVSGGFLLSIRYHGDC